VVVGGGGECRECGLCATLNGLLEMMVVGGGG
jgi:hypothetical protein